MLMPPAPVRRDSGTFRHEPHLDDDSPQIGIRKYADLDALPVFVEEKAVVDRLSVPHWFGAEGPGYGKLGTQHAGGVSRLPT